LHRIDIDGLRERAADYDDAVRGAADLDRFCTSSDWVLPAHDALMPRREPLVFRDGDAWLALARGRAPSGYVYLEPLEASWGLACPIVSTEPDLVAEVAGRLEWHVLLITGVLDRSVTQRRLVRSLGRRFNVRRGSSTTRYLADLDRGLDAYLGRRSRHLRRSLSRSRRHAEIAGVEIEAADDLDLDRAFERIAGIERQTWKGREGVGFLASGMGPFYRQMIGRLQERGALRLAFARRDGCDLAYIFGGLFAGTYRGLQFGYHADCAELALGNLCQLHQIEALCAEKVAAYDLGTTGDHYKQRWADRTITSTAIIAIRE
jgi:hypothetical protein